MLIEDDQVDVMAIQRIFKKNQVINPLQKASQLCNEINAQTGKRAFVGTILVPITQFRELFKISEFPKRLAIQGFCL